jgi:hypothetical protein
LNYTWHHAKNTAHASDVFDRLRLCQEIIEIKTPLLHFLAQICGLINVDGLV